jgi:hypothetical protein
MSSSASARASPRRRSPGGEGYSSDGGGSSSGIRGRSGGSSSVSGSPPEPRGGSPPREELASPLPRLSRARGALRPAAACGSTSALLSRAAAACAAARGGAASALPRLSLSQALASGLGNVTPGRAAFVQCHVTHLDAPPPGALAGVRTLLLSRNALRSLSGAPLALLCGLTALSAAHNVLDDVGTIPFLAAACPGLTSLSLEGNPLCELLDTRAHALAALPALRTCDGREVAPEERRMALVAVRGACAHRAMQRRVCGGHTALRARAPQFAQSHAIAFLTRRRRICCADCARRCVARRLCLRARWRARAWRRSWRRCARGGACTPRCAAAAPSARPPPRRSAAARAQRAAWSPCGTTRHAQHTHTRTHIRAHAPSLPRARARTALFSVPSPPFRLFR